MSGFHAGRAGRPARAGMSASVFSALTVLGCAGSPFRGGYSMAADGRIDGRMLASFTPGDCQDAAHGKVERTVMRVDVVEVLGVHRVLVEYRAQHEALVVENGFSDGGQFVFQLAIRTKPHRIREWRVPMSGLDPGVLSVASSWQEEKNNAGFRASLAAPDLACTLLPSAPPEPPGAQANTQPVKAEPDRLVPRSAAAGLLP
jgi:hypothetical protein